MRRLSILVLFLAVLWAPDGLLAAERSAAHLVPADAWLTVSYDGSVPGFRETPLYRFAQEPEVQAAAAQWRPVVDLLVREASKALGRDAGQILEALLSRPVVLAVARPAEGKKEPSILIVADVGTGEAAARAEAEKLLADLRQKAEPGTVKDLPPVGGAAGFSIGPAGFAFDGPFLLCANEPGLLRRATDPAAPKTAVPPGEERAVLRIRYDHQVFMELFGAELSIDARKALDAFGVSAARNVEMAFVPRDKRLVASLAINAPDAAKRKGLTKLFADASPYDPALLKMVPRDNTLFSLASPDAAALWDVAWETAAAVDPEAAERGRRTLADLEAKAGMKFRDALLAPLGRGSLFLGVQSGFSIRALLVQRVKDGKALEQGLAQLINRLDLLLMGAGRAMGAVRTGLKTFDYRGHPCRYVWLMGTPSLVLPGWAPCWTELGDAFVFAQHPLDLKGYLDFIEDKAPSVLDNQEFRSLQALVPKGALGLSYGAWPDTIVGVYNTAAPLLMIAQGFQKQLGLPRPLDLANMPSSRLIRRYAGGTLAYSTFEGGRFRIELQGNGLDFLSPHALPVVGAAAFAASAVWFVRVQAPEPAVELLIEPPRPVEPRRPRPTEF